MLMIWIGRGSTEPPTPRVGCGWPAGIDREGVGHGEAIVPPGADRQQAATGPGGGDHAQRGRHRRAALRHIACFGHAMTPAEVICALGGKTFRGRDGGQF
jgi:hypothetical protein